MLIDESISVLQLYQVIQFAKKQVGTSYAHHHFSIGHKYRTPYFEDKLKSVCAMLSGKHVYALVSIDRCRTGPNKEKSK